MSYGYSQNLPPNPKAELYIKWGLGILGVVALCAFGLFVKFEITSDQTKQVQSQSTLSANGQHSDHKLSKAAATSTPKGSGTDSNQDSNLDSNSTPTYDYSDTVASTSDTNAANEAAPTVDLTIVYVLLGLVAFISSAALGIGIACYLRLRERDSELFSGLAHLVRRQVGENSYPGPSRRSSGLITELLDWMNQRLLEISHYTMTKQRTPERNQAAPGSLENQDLHYSSQPIGSMGWDRNDRSVQYGMGSTPAPTAVIDGYISSLDKAYELLNALYKDATKYHHLCAQSLRDRLREYLDFLKELEGSPRATVPLKHKIGDLLDSPIQIETISGELRDEMAEFNGKVKIATEAARQAAIMHVRRKFNLELIVSTPGVTVYDDKVHEFTRGDETYTLDNNLNGKVANVWRRGFKNAQTGDVDQKAQVSVYRLQPAVTESQTMPKTVVSAQAPTSSRSKDMASQLRSSERDTLTPDRNAQPSRVLNPYEQNREKFLRAIAEMRSIDMSTDEDMADQHKWGAIARIGADILRYGTAIKLPNVQDTILQEVRSKSSDLDVFLPQIGQLPDVAYACPGDRSKPVTDIEQIGIIAGDTPLVSPRVRTD